MSIVNRIFAAMLLLSILTSCAPAKNEENIGSEKQTTTVTLGVERIDVYIDLIKDKKVGLLVNHTSLIGQTHLLDTLLSLEVSVSKIFTPEHGFRGDADAGEHIDNSVDQKTGINLISLYGDHKKPTFEDLQDLDIVIFDSQDVGARFFTYFSSMQYMMEACAENNIEMMILDRPNPNGHYIDGPVLEMENTSYVGLNPIPIVFAMTAGEYAKMIVGEGWIKNATNLKLTIIEMQGWDHNSRYSLTTKPSPNLPNDQSIALYPSLCLFEGTIVSVGRGTYMPFQVVGLPDSTTGEYSFTPESIDGMSKYPPYEGEKCYGLDLRNVNVSDKLNLSYLIDFYNKSKDKERFFNKYFTRLAGTKQLQQQIINGKSEEEIRSTWQGGLKEFKSKRKKYLLYNDFE